VFFTWNLRQFAELDPKISWLIRIFSYYCASKTLCLHQLNQPFLEKMGCGRIFSSAAEFFGWSGRHPLP
jgi:hypothetical protein